MSPLPVRALVGLAPALMSALGACGGAEATRPGAESTPRPSSASVLGPMCEAFVVRQRACVDEYINQVVDVRIEVDMPPGIAAQAKSEGRDALLAKARAEWVSDSTPEKMSAMCAQVAQHTPAEHVPRLRSDGERCLATTDCPAFAVCAVGNERSFIVSGDSH
jgi:hypothetical protein